jgi:aminobenzoyl-glutamate utilization protein B
LTEASPARGELKERIGGGVGGDKRLAPLLPVDFQPPIDLRRRE